MKKIKKKIKKFIKNKSNFIHNLIFGILLISLIAVLGLIILIFFPFVLLLGISILFIIGVIIDPKATLNFIKNIFKNNKKR